MRLARLLLTACLSLPLPVGCSGGASPRESLVHQPVIHERDRPPRVGPRAKDGPAPRQRAYRTDTFTIDIVGDLSDADVEALLTAVRGMYEDYGRVRRIAQRDELEGPRAEVVVIRSQLSPREPDRPGGHTGGSLVALYFSKDADGRWMHTGTAMP